MSVKNLLGYFVRGTLIVIPVVVTTYVLWLILSTLDQLLPIGIPGLGLVLMLALITLVGFATTNVVVRTLLESLDHLLAKMPLVKLVYSSIKDLIEAFVGDKRRFDRPVAVALSPGSSARLLGFVTRDDLHALRLDGYVAVYLPQSYNFAGNVLLVPASQVQLLDVPTGELMTFIVSGGVSGFGIGESLPPPPPRTPPTKTQLL